MQSTSILSNVILINDNPLIQLCVTDKIWRRHLAVAVTLLTFIDYIFLFFRAEMNVERKFLIEIT